MEYNNYNQRLRAAVCGKVQELQKDDSEDNKDNDYQYLSYLRQFNQRGRLDFNNLIFRLNRYTAILLGAYICNQDLMGGHEPCESLVSQQAAINGGYDVEKQSATYEEKILNYLSDLVRWIPRPVHRSSWRRKLRMGWISHAIFAIFFILSIISIINTVYLYKYHISCLRLKRVQDLIINHGPQGRVVFDRNDPLKGQVLRLVEYQVILEERINETRHTLNYLGDRFIDWGIINECLYLSNQLLSTMMFLVLHWLFTWMQQFDVPFHRDLQDHEDEERRSDACCEDEVLKYLESNRVYASIEASYRNFLLSDSSGNLENSNSLNRHFLKLTNTSSTTRPLDQKEKKKVRNRNNINNLDDNNNQCRLLIQILTSGALRAPTRSNLWIEQRNYVQIMIYILVPAYYILLYGACAVFTLLLDSPPGFDLGVMCEFFILVLVVCAITHHETTFFIYSMTQVKLINHNLGLIYDCIERNGRLFRRYICLVSHDRQKDCQRYEGKNKKKMKKSIVDKINSNYLFVLMTYKIFIRQLVPFKRSLWGIFLIVFSLAFLVPVIARTHVLYLAQDKHGARKARLYSFFMSLIFMIPINSVCLPMCYVHSRCVKIYKALVSLMAHIVEIRAHEQGKMIYNEHAVSVLIKEISNPRQMLEQFVVKTLGSSATFPTLLKLHLWWGLVALSILVDAQWSDHGDLFISAITDPLGVWNFHAIPE